MPREGTETHPLFHRRIPDNHLEIRCPERGRKLIRVMSTPCAEVEFGNKMPREGTEIQLPIVSRL